MRCRTALIAARRAAASVQGRPARAPSPPLHPVGLGDRAERVAFRPLGAGRAAQARRVRHPRRLAEAIASHGARRGPDRGLHAAAGRALAIDAGDGGRAAGADHPCRPEDDGGPARRAAAGRARPSKEDLVELVSRRRQANGCSTSRSSRRHGLSARHHRGRGRQRHHGAGGDLRRDAVDGAGDARAGPAWRGGGAGQAPGPTAAPCPPSRSRSPA